MCMIADVIYPKTIKLQSTYILFREMLSDGLITETIYCRMLSTVNYIVRDVLNYFG